MADMDPIDDLTNDHRQVLGMLERMEQHPEAIDTATVETVVRELSIHAAAEELVLYPAVASLVPHGNLLSASHLQEHQLAKELLVQIERAEGAELVALVNALAVYIRHHVEHEESRLFPALREFATEEQLRDIGDSLESAKQIAPTHAHPHAPNTPPVNVPAGVAASALDRVRDAVAGRNR